MEEKADGDELKEVIEASMRLSRSRTHNYNQVDGVQEDGGGGREDGSCGGSDFYCQ